MCYNINLQRNNDFGYKLPNGSWTGVTGALVDRKADFTVSPFSMSYHRFHAVDYTSYINFDDTGIIYKYPTIEPDVAGFIRPYTTVGWAAMGAAVVAMTFALFFSAIMWAWSATHRSSGTSLASSSSPPPSLQSRGSLLGDAALLTVRTILGQSITENCDGKKLLVGLWMIVSLVLGTVYKGNLKAMLIAPRVVIPFDTFEEMLAQDKMSIMMSKSSVLSRIGMISPPNSTLYRLAMAAENVVIIEEISRRMRDGSSAMVMYRSTGKNSIHFQFSLTGTCQFAMAEEFLVSRPMVIGFAKHHPLYTQIDNMIRGLREFGIIDKVSNDFFVNATHCLHPEKQKGDGLRALQMEDFYGVFSLYLAGMVLSILVMVMEVVVGWTGRRRQEKLKKINTGAIGQLTT